MSYAEYAAELESIRNETIEIEESLKRLSAFRVKLTLQPITPPYAKLLSRSHELSTELYILARKTK